METILKQARPHHTCANARQTDGEGAEGKEPQPRVSMVIGPDRLVMELIKLGLQHKATVSRQISSGDDVGAVQRVSAAAVT